MVLWWLRWILVGEGEGEFYFTDGPVQFAGDVEGGVALVGEVEDGLFLVLVGVGRVFMGRWGLWYGGVALGGGFGELCAELADEGGGVGGLCGCGWLWLFGGRGRGGEVFGGGGGGGEVLLEAGEGLVGFVEKQFEVCDTGVELAIDFSGEVGEFGHEFGDLGVDVWAWQHAFDSFLGGELGVGLGAGGPLSGA